MPLSEWILLTQISCDYQLLISKSTCWCEELTRKRSRKEKAWNHEQRWVDPWVQNSEVLWVRLEAHLQNALINLKHLWLVVWWHGGGRMLESPQAAEFEGTTDSSPLWKILKTVEVSCSGLILLSTGPEPLCGSVELHYRIDTVDSA